MATLSTPGRIHQEFFRFLYLLAHRRTQRDFASLGDDEPAAWDFIWRRYQFFWHHPGRHGPCNCCRRRPLRSPRRPFSNPPVCLRLYAQPAAGLVCTGDTRQRVVLA